MLGNLLIELLNMTDKGDEMHMAAVEADAELSALIEFAERA